MDRYAKGKKKLWLAEKNRHESDAIPSKNQNEAKWEIMTTNTVRTAFKISIASALMLLLTSGVALGASHTRSTLDRTICDSNNDNRLEWCAGESYTLLDPDTLKGSGNRTLLVPPFAQLSDMHNIDEESPARCEPSDDTFSLVGISGCYRPQDTTTPQATAAAVYAVNRARSPLSGRRVALTLNLGDEADNANKYEVKLNKKILEGGTVDPDSGDANYAPSGCNPASYPTDRYQGVKGGNEYYNPDGGNDGPGYSPSDGVRDFPTLFDKANESFQSIGLDSPWLTVRGNHSNLVQGNFSQSGFWSGVATWLITNDPLDCQKSGVGTVQPDANRKFLSTQEWIDEQAGNSNNNRLAGHGFTTGQSEPYFSFVAQGVRFIGLSSVNEDGLWNGIIRDGMLNEPDQFGFLEDELAEVAILNSDTNPNNDESVIVFAHHALEDMDNTDIAGFSDQHCGLTIDNDQSSGGVSCEILGRPGSWWPPVVGYDNKSLEQLFYENPSVVAFIAGHAHNNKITRFKNSNGSGSFWQIQVPSMIDYPQQASMVEIVKNNDANNTISIYRTVIDQASNPVVGANNNKTLKIAAASRELAFNDPEGAINNGVNPAGTLSDRNAEMVLDR